MANLPVQNPTNAVCQLKQISSVSCPLGGNCYTFGIAFLTQRHTQLLDLERINFVSLSIVYSTKCQVDNLTKRSVIPVIYVGFCHIPTSSGNSIHNVSCQVGELKEFPLSMASIYSVSCLVLPCQSRLKGNCQRALGELASRNILQLNLGFSDSGVCLYPSIQS